MKRLAQSCLALALVAAPLAAKADTIINLNATTPADSIGGIPNSLTPSFYSTITLAAGTYTVKAVGTSTSGALYGGWNQAMNAGAPGPTSWEERVGFNTVGGDNFSYNTTTGAANYNYTYAVATDTQLFSGLYGSAAAALAGNPTPYTFTLATSTAVTFYIPDQPSGVTGGYYPGFTDNSGGVSLDLAVAPTPEPSSFILLGTGMLAAAGAVRRRFVK